MIILKNSSNVTQYTFPSSVALVDEPWSKRLNTEDRAYQAGGVLVSDEKVATRVISLHGIFAKTSQTLMEAELRSMKKAVYTEDLRLYSTQFADDFYKVECLNFEHTFLGPLTIVEINIDFLVNDPFRYYKDATSDDETISESPHSYTIANDGDIELSPIITWTVGAGASISKIRITNITDDGRYFVYQPAANLTSGAVIIFDMVEGTVKLNSVSDIAHWSGAWFKLLSGNNSISVVTSGTVGTNNCNFLFRKRWL